MTFKFQRTRSHSAFLPEQPRKGSVWSWRPRELLRKERPHKRKAKENIHSGLCSGIKNIALCEPGLVPLAVPPAPHWPLGHLDPPYYLGLDVGKPQPLLPKFSWSKVQHVLKVVFGRKWIGKQNKSPQRPSKTWWVEKGQEPKVTGSWAPMACLSGDELCGLCPVEQGCP